MQLNPLRRQLIRRVSLHLVSLGILTRPVAVLAGDVGVQVGNTYKITRPVYLMAVYESIDAARAARATLAYLRPEPYAKTRWTAFQCEIPAGTVITIVRPAPPGKDLWHRFGAYYVRLEPDTSRGLDVIVELFKGFAGESGDLSKEFFERIDAPTGIRHAETASCNEPK
jgi:hypothetical protein